MVYRNQEQHEKRFLQFDLVPFYPTISEQLLKEAITWGRQQRANISDIEEKAIFTARRNFLWYKGIPWKKQDSPSFDVTMGSYDRAEICKLVGLYILDKIVSCNIGIKRHECGLYRDDGLICSKKSKRELDTIRKKLHKLFTTLGLGITVEAGLKQVNFLDIHLVDLTTGTFQPYKKDASPPVYVHRKSDHPPAITKNIPAMIEKRINN